MTQNILVIGETGQLARALKKEGRGQDLPLLFAGRGALNLSASSQALRKKLMAYDDLGGIILAAAYTDVDGAETHEETAQTVNGIAPGIIARFCAETDIPFVHVSTDYVFDGQGSSPYHPGDTTSPVNAYGRSKKVGELAVLSSRANAAILRTSWLYDGTGKNFLTTMLNLAKSKDTVRVVSDQIGRPTFALHLARACLATLTALQKGGPMEPRLFHVTDSGDPTTWSGFAEFIFENARRFLPQVPVVEPILSKDYPTPAKRPAYSVLDISDYEEKISAALPDWREGVRLAVLEYFSE